ncbi:MAG: penicillin acylase family protein [Gemmatimonadales bacterium]
MKRALGILGIAGVVVLTLFGAARLWLGSSLPPLGGREPVAGLGDSVVVLWDSLAVPHVLAASDSDFFTALGYLHARDRMWQMDLLRHAAEGRLSELFGAQTVASDRALRQLELRRIALARWAGIGPASRRLAAAYARGVNAWLGRGNRALEFRLLGHAPEPWEPLHSQEVGVLQAWDLRSSGDELELATAARQLGAARAAELVPEYPDTAPVIVAGYPCQPPCVRRTPALGAGLPLRTGPGRTPPPPAASNSWVIAGRRTASGKPILANDPHLTLRAPGVWYLVGAHSPGYEVVGATIPGAPVVVLGHTRHVAWGFTNGMVDDVDYVVEQLSPDSTRYRTAAGWATVEVVAETINVKGEPQPVVYARRRTGHGPLVDAGDGLDSNRALAMRWVGQDAGSDELGALVAMARATSWASFATALRAFRSPEQNVVYADATGVIAYVLAGYVPVRRRGGGDGITPTRGWTEEGRWERYLTSEELPRALNPLEGFIVTANNRIVGPAFPFVLTRSWDLPYRAQRIRELLQADSPATAVSVSRHQLDVVDPFGRAMKGLAARAALDAGRADLADRLRSWTGAMHVEAIEPTLFWAWYRELQRLTFQDDATDYWPAWPLHRWLARGESPWFDHAGTSDREDLQTLSRLAMRHVLDRGDVAPWGRVHETVMEHPLAATPLLGRLVRFSVGPLAAAGGNFTVNVSSSSRGQPPFRSTWGPSLRHVVDLGDVDGPGGGFILPGGQSGHPLSPHYRDQTAKWLRGELWVLPLELKKLVARDTLRLVK